MLSHECTETVLTSSVGGKAPPGCFLLVFLMMILAWPFQATPSHSESPGWVSAHPGPTAPMGCLITLPPLLLACFCRPAVHGTAPSAVSSPWESTEL